MERRKLVIARVWNTKKPVSSDMNYGTALAPYGVPAHPQLVDHHAVLSMALILACVISHWNDRRAQNIWKNNTRHLIATRITSISQNPMFSVQASSECTAHRLVMGRGKRVYVGGGVWSLMRWCDQIHASMVRILGQDGLLSGRKPVEFSLVHGCAFTTTVVTKHLAIPNFWKWLSMAARWLLYTPPLAFSYSCTVFLT